MTKKQNRLLDRLDKIARKLLKEQELLKRKSNNVNRIIANEISECIWRIEKSQFKQKQKQ